ncbi:hypothetical protein Ade02nite_60980 [Paractinoplanes deccanensis]|uniref:Uncharacterized protein n=1 Tax=Paractinoplanes deccanensis TaxID=113561 RepID=A0ABQ3YBV5_9ACTN|nr:hypothetical protein [Actinoplanes deccanensis]GID77457.1 hypothetical protein Ade02nite_60980 [Actinoplanes deccanensis]
MWRGRWLSYVYLGIGFLLLVAAFFLLYPVRDTEGFGTDLRINIGANLLDLVLAALVLQPLILFLNRNAVKRRNRLDYRAVIKRIEDAADRVDIWKHWTGLLEAKHERAFTSAVLKALERGVRFRIVLTDPSSPAAAERARQVAPTDAVALMRQNIERLDEFVGRMPANFRDLFTVRISQAGPAHALYRVDDWLSYGIFRDRRVSESSQREVRVRGDLGELALEAFDNRWKGPGLLTLAEHERMPLRLTVAGETAEHELRYVLYEGEHWVNVNPAALSQAFHPDHQVIGDGARRYVLAEASPETRERVAALYAAKYGPDQGAVLLRLIGA